MSHIVQVDPLAPRPKEGEIFEEYQVGIREGIGYSSPLYG